jgi:vanillate O-demethylase monooxygenase subunit
MRLSLGKVKDDALQCPYHGWSFRSDGEGRCPATPELHARAACFDAVERGGAIWLKSKAASPEFPRPDFDDFQEVGTLHHVVEVPLEIVLDNFIEVEHTGSTHAFLGYETSRMHEVTVDVELTPDTVRVVNKGPQRELPALLRAAFRIRAGDSFTDDWTTYFSPVYSVYDQYWTDPVTGEVRDERIRVAVFFTPADAGQTHLFTFAYASKPAWARFGIDRLMRPLILALVDLEVRLDKRMIERLADTRPELTGNRLGRFDQALVEARKRIDSLYRAGSTLKQAT